MSDFSDKLWGVVFLIIALIVALHFLDIWTFPFFDGWWTLFIIIPSLIALTKQEDRIGGAIGLIIGLLFLVSANDLIDFSIIWKVIVVIVLIAIGLSLIFKNKTHKELPNLNKNSRSINAIFSGNKVYYDDTKEFKGCDSKAVFGGIEIDLRDALIKRDTEINVVSLFGGTDIRVPRNVNIEINSTGIFGGTDNHTSNSSNNEFTIYINAVAIFGGVDIK